jgi:hypothetical protein
MASVERKLIVEITSARALMPKDGEGSSNAYCVVRSSFFVSVVAHVLPLTCYLPYDEYGTGFAKLDIYLSFLLNLPAAGNLDTYFGHVVVVVVVVVLLLCFCFALVRGVTEF